MPRKLEREAKPVTIRLFVDDLDQLIQTYTGTGYNAVIRALVARHVRKLRTRTVEILADEELTKEELESV
jgi:hypothetical protein